MDTPTPLAADHSERLELSKQLALEKSANRILMSLAKKDSLAGILAQIVQHCEKHDPSIRASILLYDENSKRLNQLVAPNLPEDYNALIGRGIPLGPANGSCGAAAYTRQLTIADDIQQDPRWKPHKAFTDKSLEHGLLSCWSLPFFSSQDELLGTIANYGMQTGQPTTDNLKVLNWAGQVAAAAVQHERMEKQLQISQEKYRAIVSAMSDLVFVLDSHDKVIDAHCPSQHAIVLPANDILGKSIQSLIPEAAVGLHQACAAEVRQSGENRRYEYSRLIQGNSTVKSSTSRPLA